MGVAIVLLLIVIGSVVFHLLTPWWLTPLASNWKDMDSTLSITMAVTGAFFVVILLFVCYTLWRYTHRPGSPRATATTAVLNSPPSSPPASPQIGTASQSCAVSIAADVRPKYV